MNGVVQKSIPFRRGLLAPLSRRLAELLPGLAACAAITICAIVAGDTAWARTHALSALVIAMAAGALAGNLLPRQVAGVGAAGIALSRQKLLRLGIVLYGVRLTLADIATVGLSGVLVDALVLGSTFMLAMFAGIRVLKIDRTTAMLIGAGSAICGAAAVLATEPVTKARSAQVTVAVATVVIFGTLATFLYPVLYRLNLEWQIVSATPTGFGLYAGSTIHEVAQVVAAARSMDDGAVNTAVIAKMVRVMMLPLFLLALSAFLRRGTSAMGQDKTPLAVPWFAFGFVAVVMLHSALALPAAATAVIIDIDTILLTMAMAGLGLTTHLSAFRQAGLRPVVLAAILFAWLVAGGGWINRLLSPF